MAATQNTDIELSKYYNISGGTEPNKQTTRFGHFASVPRLLDVLCTVPLSGLTLFIEHQVYKFDGVTKVGNPVTGSQRIYYDTAQALKTTNSGSRAYTVEIGAKVVTKLYWKFEKQLYQSADGEAILKDVYTLEPTTTSFTVAYSNTSNANKVEPSAAWKAALPANNTNSATETLNNVQANASTPNLTQTTITYTRIITRAKSAPTVENISGSQALKLPSGTMSNSVSCTLSFQYYTFAGGSQKDINNIAASDIVNASGVAQLRKCQNENQKSGFVTSRGRTINNVVTQEGEYFVYAYPKVLGNLSGIIADGAAPVLDSFYSKEITITNPYGANITYLVYVSKNPKAFAGSKLACS